MLLKHLDDVAKSLRYYCLAENVTFLLNAPLCMQCSVVWRAGYWVVFPHGTGHLGAAVELSYFRPTWIESDSN